MNLLLFIAKFTICLWSWHYLIQTFQLWLEPGKAQKVVPTLLQASLQVETRSHQKVIEISNLSSRFRLLSIALRPLIYSFVFLSVFLIPLTIQFEYFALLGLIGFVFTGWFVKKLRKGPLCFMAYGAFCMGLEGLVQFFSQYITNLQDYSWIFQLSENYFTGVLMGVGIGFILRGVFRVLGITWWISFAFLSAGILSLGCAWGFILGEFLFTSLEDLFVSPSREFRWRAGITFGFGIFTLMLATPYEAVIMDLISGSYSVQLRMLQLAVMIFIFLLLESALALAFFHFYFHKQTSHRP